MGTGHERLHALFEPELQVTREYVARLAEVTDSDQATTARTVGALVLFSAQAIAGLERRVLLLERQRQDEGE